MNINKENIKILIKVILFLLIFSLLFLFFTYYLRNTDRVSRQNILEFYDEPKDSLDVVFIGASGIYRYWDPMLAWQEYGISSRNFSTSEMHIATYLTAIKEILETQDPKLIVLEGRQFTKTFNTKSIVAGARRVIDSMDIGIDRLAAAKYYCDVMDIPWKESVSLYVDLIQYHDNYDAFRSDINLELADNRLDTVIKREHCYKGHAITAKHAPFKDPSRFLSDERMKLDPTAELILRDILSWCSEHDVPLLVLATPYCVTEDNIAKMNTMQDITESYGYPYVNTNFSYNEIGLSFAEDLYDEYHVNVIGSQKFTKYFAEYLVQSYSLPDHRNESNYTSWNLLAEEYSIDAAQQKESVLSLLENEKAVASLAQTLTATSDPVVWVDTAAHQSITVMTMSNAPLSQSPTVAAQRLALQTLGITDGLLNGNGKYMTIYNNILQNTVTKKASGKVNSNKLTYSVQFGTQAQFVLDGCDYFCNAANGIQMIAINNYTNTIIDSVIMTVDENGSLMLTHNNKLE